MSCLASGRHRGVGNRWGLGYDMLPSIFQKLEQKCLPVLSEAKILVGDIFYLTSCIAEKTYRQAFRYQIPFLRCEIKVHTA